jgi:phage shock protein PspC (stress-responsive transcriptional regulator)
MDTMEHRLYRSQTDRMLGGVCGGLAKYLQIDVTLVRLFFVVFTLLGGIGPLVYIIMWIVVDDESKVSPAGAPSQPLNGEELKDRAETVRDEFVTAVRQPNTKALRFIGIALILGGLYIFLRQLHIPWLTWLNNGVVLAILVVIVGVALLMRAVRKEQ